MKMFKRRYWVNLTWLRDNKSPNEVYLYKTMEECLATLPLGDELRQVEIREIEICNNSATMKGAKRKSSTEKI